MKKITFLFALLCASVMSMKLWAVAEDTYIGTTDATYANQFKWYSVSGKTAPQEVVNIQPGTNGIALYVNVGTDLFDGVNYDGVSIATADLADYYAKTGAGAWFYLSKFTAKCTTIEVTNGGSVIRAFRVQNDKGTGDACSTGGGSSEPTKASECFGAKGHFGNPSVKNVYYQIDYENSKVIVSLLSLTGYPLDFAEIQITGVGGYAMTANGAGGYTYTFNNPTVDAEWYIRFLYSDTNMPGNEMTAETQSSSDANIIYYQVGACTATTTENTNIALSSAGASATASDGNPALAIDGNTGSRWETAASDPQWICVDFGERKKFNTVQLVHEGAFIKTYDIQISDDGTNFTTIKHVSETLAGFPYEQTIELNFDYAAQYMRIYGTERGTGWGYSLWELRAMYSGASVLTSITLAAADTKTLAGGAGVVLTATPKDQKGAAMDEAVSYEITPAAAGHMSGNTYIPDQVGLATIRAYSGSIYSNAVQVLGVTSANLALSTNISTDNKIIAQSEFAPNGTDAFFAVDGNMGSVWQGSPTNGNVNDSREYDCWFVVDLGAFYNIDMVALHFEGACSELYHIDFSEDNSTWNLGYNLVGAEGVNARNDYWTDLDNNNKVRYVRFWSTKAATGWGMKMFEFEVYGTEWVSGDEEKPVMVSASLVSSTTTSAVIAVAATDNDEVARYHVVDGVNGIDANYTPSEGKITINGLTHNTAYNFTITAKDASNNESENSKAVAVTTPFDGSINLALNQPCEGGYYDGNPAEVAAKANDGDNGTAWVTYGDHAAALDWWIVDLGKVYDLSNITALWANDAYATAYMLQARVEEPAAADKADDAAWVTLENVSGVTAGEERSTDVSGVGRYVRFRATAKAGGFFRLREFRVYGSGVATVDTEAPVMTSASLVSSADTYAVIAVSATDNQGIANYHVVDAANSIDGHYAAEAGNITVTGLTGGTSYTLAISAVDFFGNESANSKSVAVTTTAHYTEPQEACTAPAWDASLVKAIYSPTYSADCNFANWGGCVAYTDDTYGKKYAMGADCWGFGLDGFTLNCLNMEKLHADIWIADDASLRLVPIYGGTGLDTDDTHGKMVTLHGQQWNSIDLSLANDFAGLNLASIFQFKIDNANGLTFWIGNLYFYRETAIVDSEVPTSVSASVASEGFYSVSITAQAEDNSGAVSFKVMNGDAQVATGAAASGAATTITISGLAAGTNYSFNVIAYDEAGNEAAPVAVVAATKALPAAAPAPNLSGKRVVNVFSDAIEGSKTIHSGGWSETTIAQWIDIVPGDKVFYGQKFNYAGWHSWGDDIDATGMVYLHVDVYSTGMTQVSVTPISHDPGREGSADITLTPNDWTSADIALSAYAANNIEWNKIFQFKFMGAVGGDELLIDNVYFWRPADYTRAVTAGRYGTICLPQAGEMVGATLYDVAYLDVAANKIFLDEVPEGEMIAGRPYIFEPEGSSIEVYYTDDETASAGNYHGLYGFIGNSADEAYSIPQNQGCYILQNNQYREVQDGNAVIKSNRAYFKIGSGDGCVPTNAEAPAPGRRRVALGAAAPQVATGMEALSAGDQPVKVMIDGQLFILRGEKLYNVNGQAVK